MPIPNVQSDRKPASLREPGAILLLSCYELGHQPIGLAQPIAFLEQAGYSPAALDIAVEQFDEQAGRRARFVGISVPMHTALRLGVRAAELIRAVNPACHICFYGLYASLNAQYLLQQVADSVIGGEYEIPLVNLVQALEGGRCFPAAGRQPEGDSGGFPEIEGVSLAGKIVEPLLKRPPAVFPVPDRSRLPKLPRYAHLEHNGTRHPVGYVEASRGCLHHCLHCPIVPVYEGRFFVFPEAAVLEDLRRQVRAGATHITFGDPDFLNGPGHSLSLVRKMHGEFPHVTFDVTTKIEHILKHHTVVRELGALGCLFVVSAVESFSDIVLDHLQKGHRCADIVTALGIVRDAGIALRPSLVAFTPWTTLGDYLDLLELIEANGLIDAVDPVQYTIRLLVPPGSALLNGFNGHPAAIRQFLGPLDQAGFQYQWAHPDPRMDRLHGLVSTAVEEAARIGEDPAVTFDRLRTIACEVAGRQPPAPAASHGRLRERPRPPRLTEPWFCCAEPTQGQFGSLKRERQDGV